MDSYLVGRLAAAMLASLTEKSPVVEVKLMQSLYSVLSDFLVLETLVDFLVRQWCGVLWSRYWELWNLKCSLCEPLLRLSIRQRWKSASIHR